MRYFDNATELEKRQKTPWCREYYELRGYSTEDTDMALYNVAATFSLNKCITKFGEIDGKQLFDERQAKWQNTLNNKPIDEIIDMNTKKGVLHHSHLWKDDLDIPGEFYIIQLSETQHKIGITSHDVNRRYAKQHLIGKTTRSFGGITVKTAFMLEQVIKRKYPGSIKRADYGVFGWTEVLNNTSINSIQDHANHYIADLETLKIEFDLIRSIQ
jgi:hypothetical protein